MDKDISLILDHIKNVMKTQESIIKRLGEIEVLVGKPRIKKQRIRELTPSTSEFLKIDGVLSLLPIGRSTWYLGVKEGRFPQPVKLGGLHSAAWRRKDIEKLMDSFKPKEC